jgi:hypothetical protein
MLSISSKKFIESLESYKSMMKNRKLAAISEHKRRLSQIKKTYMNDVIKHQLSFL